MVLVYLFFSLELPLQAKKRCTKLGGYEAIVIMASGSSMEQLTSSVALPLLCQYFAR